MTTKLTTLKPAKGSTKARKRVGRGAGSGIGGTSGRGTKGQNARKSGGVRATFEGGQTPLIKRMPKLKGFRNINRVENQVVNVSDLVRFAGTEVSIVELVAAGLVSSAVKPVKILGNGLIEVAVTVKGFVASKTAIEKIEKAGGRVEA